MEPLKTTLLGGTVLEFARFCIELLSDGFELYRSSHGALPANEQLELATADLRGLLVKLTFRERPSGSQVDHDDPKSFEHILCGAEEVAAELVERLERLKVKNVNNKKWESVRKAVHSIFAKNEIESLKKRLANFKDAVQMHVLSSILYVLPRSPPIVPIDPYISRTGRSSIMNRSKTPHFDHLDKNTQIILQSLLESCKNGRETTVLVRDIQDQLATLVQVLTRIDDMNIDDHHIRTRMRIMDEQVQALAARGIAESGMFQELTARFEMLNVSIPNEAKLRRKVQDDILRTLVYPAMTARYEDIVEAFPETFEWAFKVSTSEQIRWDNLSEWLKAGSGLYWISGKAGSGKSTLMKHIFDDARTRRYLEHWARLEKQDAYSFGSMPLCLATFFFWNSGTPVQKSQNGMLRALLHQVLVQHPQLISVVFPELWGQIYSETIQGRPVGGMDHVFTGSRLATAFQKLTGQDIVPIKLCFLIDGLDEFYGDHEELASLLKMASSSLHVKICVSSRPWVIFEQIYASRPSMRPQDLTYHDIKHYVDSKFKNSSAFEILQNNDPISARLLRMEVIEKAEGVFLWVELVVRSLLLGIRNQDDLSILHQRLLSMPQKLENLYLHFICLIEPVYLVWSSKAFQIFRAAREFCAEASAGSVHRDEGSTPLYMSTFFFAMAENIHYSVESSEITVLGNSAPSSAHTTTIASLRAKCANFRIHLIARCAGLLEVPRFEQEGPMASVRFYHRTARDFLFEDRTWSQILVRTSGASFDPYTRLFLASVLDLTVMTRDERIRNSTIYRTTTGAMMYAWYINAHQIHNEMETLALDTLDRVMACWTSRSYAQNAEVKFRHWTWHMNIGQGNDSNLGFLQLATAYSLANYVDEKLAQWI